MVITALYKAHAEGRPREGLDDSLDNLHSDPSFKMEPKYAKVTNQEAGGGWKRRIVNYVAVIIVFASTNCTWAAEEEGDWCVNDEGEEGICRSINQCPGFQAKLSIYHIPGPNTPGLCFYSDTKGAIVCCLIEERTTTIDYKKYFPNLFSRPEDTRSSPATYDDYDTVEVALRDREPVTLRISEQKCQEYEAEVGSSDGCEAPPRPAAFIVGGQRAARGEYPHMAVLGYLNSMMVVWLCGGTLISRQYILTAAHCHTSVWGPMVVARLGELLVKEVKWLNLTMSAISRTGNSGNHAIDTIISHPDYKPNSYYNDIALVRLIQPIYKFSELVRPACLYTQPEAIGFNLAIATGWGATKNGGDNIEERPLMQVDLNLYDNEFCSNEYRAESLRSTLRRGIDESMICAGDLDGGKDTCQGDSGGPLQVRSSDMGCLHRVLGVTSFGKACGFSSVALYTKVSSYLDWIESIVWPEGSNDGSPSSK